MSNSKAKNTAIGRIKPSKPALDMIAENIFNDGSILDYGCGRGMDVDYFNSINGLTCRGYDLHHRPIMPIGEFRYGTCTYVLNAIDNEEERLNVIRDLVSRVKTIIVITTRTATEINYLAKRGSWINHNDGFKTKNGTFQLGFSSQALVALVSKAMQGMGQNGAFHVMSTGSSKYTQVTIIK